MNDPVGINPTPDPARASIDGLPSNANYQYVSGGADQYIGVNYTNPDTGQFTHQTFDLPRNVLDPQDPTVKDMHRRAQKKNTKKPKEIINTEHDAVHRHVTPNVVRTHKVPVPYHSDGYADDTPQNVTRRTHARRRPIHRMSSLVTKTHKDEPGDPDGGVQSSTRSSVITPITHAPAVRAEGSPVNRHQDYFHGNNKNHLMQVNHVHKTNTYSTSDDQMNDAPERSDPPPSQAPSQGSGSDPGAAFTKNFTQGSSTIQAAQGAINNAQYFYNNPGQILPSAANTASNIWTGASTGVSNAYNYVTNLTPEQAAALPGQAVEGVKNAAVGAYNHYSNIYKQDGVAGLGGALAGNALDFGVQYLLTDGLGKVAGTVVKGAETAEEAGAVARKAEEAGKAGQTASEDGNVRVSREENEPNKRGETCECP